MKTIFKKILLAIGILSAVVFLHQASFAQAPYSIKFDSSSQVEGGISVNSTCYVKSLKVRMEIQAQGQETVFIMDGQNSYMYFPSSKIAIPIPVQQASGQVPVPTSYKDIPGLVKVGEEEVNGKPCDVYEYNEKGNRHKIWVDKEIDFPVKSESMTGNGKVVNYISNVQKNIALDDSLFKLPADAQIMDQKAMEGMGGF